MLRITTWPPTMQSDMCSAAVDSSRDRIRDSRQSFRGAMETMLSFHDVWPCRRFRIQSTRM